jgi:hypothetical protein
MPFTSRPLLAHQHRALAAAAGLVGRPRLAAGLALTLACACGPLTDDSSDTGVDPSSSATTTTASSGGATSSGGVGSSSTSSDDAGHSNATSDATLLTDASTTLGDAPTSTTTDTGDTTSTGTTGELDDCFLNTRTMEVDWDCCEQQNWLPSPQCTPWGPPAPPVAGARMQAARQARQVLA